MRHTERHASDVAAVLARWWLEATPLTCSVEIDRSQISIPACLFTVVNDADGPRTILFSGAGSFVLIDDWEDACDIEIRRTRRGTKVEVIYHRTHIVMTDY